MIHIFKREEIADVLDAIYNSERNATLFWTWDSGFDFRIGSVDHDIYQDLPQEIRNDINYIDWWKIEEVVSALAYSMYKFYKEPRFVGLYESKVIIKN